MDEIHSIDTIKENLLKLGYDDNIIISNIKMIGEKEQNLVNIYKIDDYESKILKIRGSNSFNIKNALTFVNCIKDKNELIERYTKVHRINDAYYLITDYIEGYNPIVNKDEIMPKIFEGLASIHLENPTTDKFYSKYSDGRVSKTIEHMVDSEIEYHFTYMENHKLKKQISDNIQQLKTCIPCIIHEDVHPGNVIVSNDNKMKLIDCEWLHSGINIYEFEYVDLFNINNNWWNINKSALDCYKAYYKKLDIDLNVANEQIKAFELLKILRLNTFWRYFKTTEKYPLVESTVNKILDYGKFI